MTDWKRTLHIVFVSQLLSTLGFSTIFPFLSLYVKQLGTHTSLSLDFWAAAVFSTQAFTMMIASPIWGALSDRFGRKLMLERALYGGALIIFLMGFARSAEELTALRAIQGLLTGTAAAGSALVAASMPREKSGQAMGLLQVARWIGVALGPLMGGVVADLAGFRTVFTLTSLLILAGGLVVTFGMRETFTPVIRRHGHFAYFSDWGHIFAEPGITPVYLIRFAGYLGRNIIIPFAPLFIATLLVNKSHLSTLTGLTVGLEAAAGVLGALILGKLGDRIGHRRILFFSALAAAFFYLPQSLVSSVWQLIALQIMDGMAIGGLMPSLSALLSRYSDPGEEGSVYGLDNAVVSASRTVAPLVGAALVTGLGFGYRSIFVATGLMFVVTAIVAFYKLPEPRTPVKKASAPAPGD
jgi:DHA1 family multidrug resistance protein-like MFS transporter